MSRIPSYAIPPMIEAAWRVINAGPDGTVLPHRLRLSQAEIEDQFDRWREKQAPPEDAKLQKLWAYFVAVDNLFSQQEPFRPPPDRPQW